MNEIKRSIIIDAPANEVFEYISNYQNWPEFYKGVSNVKPITEKTRSTGSKFIYKVKVLGINFTVGTEFRDFIENEGWNGKSFKGIEHKTQWIIMKSNEKTEFTHGLIYKIPWYLGGKIYNNAFGKAAWTKIIEVSLLNVKRIMEVNN